MSAELQYKMLNGVLITLQVVAQLVIIVLYAKALDTAMQSGDPASMLIVLAVGVWLVVDRSKRTKTA